LLKMFIFRRFGENSVKFQFFKERMIENVIFDRFKKG